MWRVVVLLIVVGCGGARPAERPLPQRTPYLELFEHGRSWTLPVHDGTPVTCTVTDVKQVGDANVSRLDCGALLVSGTWVATPAGLYHPYLPVDEPDELALLGEDDLLLGAIPGEREHEHVLEGGARSAIEAVGYDGSWCVRETTTLGTDMRSYVLCVDGANITGGGEETSGSQPVYFGKAPPPDSDS
jgi:hypothetical protein